MLITCCFYVDLFDDEGFSLSDINETITRSEVCTDDIHIYFLESKEAHACFGQFDGECLYPSGSIANGRRGGFRKGEGT